MHRLARGLAASLALALVAALLWRAARGPARVRPLESPRAAAALAQGSVAMAVQRSAPAVVGVTAVTAAAVPGGGLLLTAEGSGFVVDPRGGILTSASLVRGAQRIVVRLHRGLALAAVGVRLDRRRDVALLQVRPGGRLPTLPLGSPAAPAAGTYVVSLGDAGATLGVVSSGARGVAVAGGRPLALLQTDAPLLRGNVGGPLLDVAGRVVGMATFSISGGQGIGFAVPAGEIRAALKELT